MAKKKSKTKNGESEETGLYAYWRAYSEKSAADVKRMVLSQGIIPIRDCILFGLYGCGEKRVNGLRDVNLRNEGVQVPLAQRQCSRDWVLTCYCPMTVTGTLPAMRLRIILKMSIRYKCRKAVQVTHLTRRSCPRTGKKTQKEYKSAAKKKRGLRSIKKRS